METPLLEGFGFLKIHFRCFDISGGWKHCTWSLDHLWCFKTPLWDLESPIEARGVSKSCVELQNVGSGRGSGSACCTAQANAARCERRKYAHAHGWYFQMTAAPFFSVGGLNCFQPSKFIGKSQSSNDSSNIWIT